MIRKLLPSIVAAALLSVAAGAQAQALDSAEMMRFLVQAQCLGGSGHPSSATPIDPACGRRQAQTPDDRATYRKADWGDVRSPASAATGHQISDALLSQPPRSPGDAITIAHTFDFGFADRGFGQFDPRSGDGGHVITVEGGRASIFMTEDGGGGLQWFVGEGCRTGQSSSDRAWLLFGQDATRGAWRDDIARLVITKSRDECPAAFSSAYTRYIRADVSLPFRRAGQAIGARTLDAIVSEHYDLPSISQSTHLERFYLAKDLGLVRWERWERTGPAIHDRAAQLAAAATCPRVGFSEAPAADWVMVDCRMWTNLVPVPGPWAVRGFDWSGLSTRAAPAR